jgi:N-carbamoylputrescine amidase
MAHTLTLASAQTGAVLDSGQTARMTDLAASLIDQGHGRGVQLMVFPELFMAPFFACRLEERFGHYFMPADDKAVRAIAAHAASRGMALILPIAESAPDGYYNSALAISHKGETVGVYRKTHIPAYFPNDKPGGTGSYEKFYFAPGRDLPVFDLCGARVGVQICNDRLYPEASRALALQGAQIIAMPIAFSTYSDPTRRASIWEVPPRSRAYENGVYVVATNRAGIEGPRHHLGHSMIVDPYGMIQERTGGEENVLVVHQADLDEIDRARTNFPWWRDRRPDLYAALAR